MAYIYKSVDVLDNSDLIGTRQCVALIQHYASVPTHLVWKQGKVVKGNLVI